MKKNRILAASLVVLATAWAACTVKTVDDDEFTSGPGAGGSGNSGNDGGTPSTGGNGGTGPGSGGGGSDACIEDCYAQNPNGAGDYDTLLSCTFCGSCFDICEASTQCEGGSELGCSADATDCDSCANSICSVGYDMNVQNTCGMPAEPTAVCIAEFEQCFCMNDDCAALADCILACP
jgi:hypothetical protein